MIPKIKFIWSYLYQLEIHSQKVDTEEYNYEEYEKYVLDFIKELEKEWEKFGKSILEYMKNLTGLKWNREAIECYVIKISTYTPISSPLTIPIQLQAGKEIYTLSIDRYIDMLIHELIHNLFIDNKNTDDYFMYLINEKYKNEEFNTAIHVPIHTIHKKIFLKFFDKKRLESEINMSSYYPAYKRSWEIVNQIGEDKIIEEMKKKLE